jgi:hypothetical protein
MVFSMLVGAGLLGAGSLWALTALILSMPAVGVLAMGYDLGEC